MSLAEARSVEDIEKVLQGALKVIPKSVNPWTLFESRAIVILNHAPPEAFSPLLMTASVLLVSATILYLAGMFVRWRKGTLWFFRIVRIGEERFVLPHYICTYVTLITVFNICLQSFLWIVWFRAVKHKQAKNHFLANSLPWIPGVLAVCLAVWSLMTTWVLHVRAYRDGQRPWYTSARFVNSVGGFLPALVLVTLLPYGIIASNNLQARMEASGKLYELLESEAKNWTPGSIVDPSQLHLTSVLVHDVARKMLAFGNNYEIFFSILAGWCGFLGLSFVAVASLYLRDLKRSIKGMQGRTKTGVETFSKTYRWLVLVSVGLGTSMIALSINTSWIAATLKKILADGTTNAIAIIIPLFTVAVLGIPVSLVILHNALSTPSARSHAPSPSSQSHPSTSTLTSKQRQHQENLDHMYTTQFDLVAAIPLDRFAFLSNRTDTRVHLEGVIEAVPFDSLELQPTPTNHTSGKKKLEGIVVERSEETVTVVALPKEGHIASEWNNFDDEEEEKKW
ncbi:hypothetical protein JCM3765_005312 [Sporobolomyces pararoseus]